MCQLIRLDALKRSILYVAIAAAGTSATSRAEVSAMEMESIIVIGEKSERSLKQTTSSVSVISEEALNSLQNHTINNFVAEVPNVVVTSGAVANIRGVNGNGSAGGFNSITGGAKGRVSTLIDGVAEPFVADFTGDSGVWDIEQIEVYRGAQSTSHGRNSIGGMIYVKTKDPSFDWEGAARMGYRNQENYIDTAVMLSGPIVEDTLAFRVTAQQLNAETLTDDSGFDGHAPDYDLNEIDTTRLKAKFLWTPNEDFNALLTHSTNNEQGDTGRVYYAATDPYDYERIFFRDIETDSDTTSLKLDHRINDSVSAELLVAYMDYQWGFDSYEADPADEQQVIFDQSSITVDAKLTFGQADSFVRGFVGLAYFEREQDFESTGAYAYEGDDESSSKALYGEFTVSPTDRLHLTAGLRQEKEQQKRRFNYITYSRASNLDTDKTITLPKLALQYDLTDNTSVGISARKGYNAPGGAFAFASSSYYYYDEETVKTYEASVRSNLFNGRLNISANLFLNDYEGYQALSSSRAIVNMDEVETYGLELSLQASLTDKLQVQAGLGLLETEITDPGDGYETAKGNELSTAPGVTGSLGFIYNLTPNFDVGISARYVDEYFGGINNTEERIAGDYTVTRLSANYSSNNWTINAYVNNLFDEKALTIQEPVSGRYPQGFAGILDPRSVGVTVTYNFM